MNTWKKEELAAETIAKINENDKHSKARERELMYELMNEWNKE